MNQSEGRKRRYNPSDKDNIPDVEKLYRQKQPSFARAGGFVAEEDEEVERRKAIAAVRKKKLDDLPRPETTDCEKCGGLLLDSWLWTTFALAVCDDCKDPNGEHGLISRTQAKEEYLLKDEDLDKRTPVLRFMAKKNPHNPRYGDMKLYVKSQIVERMVMVHGSIEALEIKKEARKESKEKRAEAAFDRKAKEIRQHVRGSKLVKAREVDIHVHEFGEERHVVDDEWEKKCDSCGYTLSFEKM